MVKLTFHLLDQRSYSPTMRMYAPLAYKATSPNEERSAHSELLPCEPLCPINSTGPFRLLVGCSFCSLERGLPWGVVNGR